MYNRYQNFLVTKGLLAYLAKGSDLVKSAIMAKVLLIYRINVYY